MGVPKFYRWLSERYPCLSEVISDSQIPEFDNLYLDMNGIIHNCSHPNDDDVTFRITEEQIFIDITKYIEKLYAMIRPEKVFFMAIDGVAPRAKMNQQRARRFMSARTAAEQLAAAKRKNEAIPDGERFDSNCITPGTPFMDRLHKHLQDWMTRKVNTDSNWQNREIFLSGHNCPGEGEHKIMDFIRTARSKEGYDPNTRHCMYGLDADLMMLGMCSHEPHFSLLREEVKFNRPMKHKKVPQKTAKTSSPAETKFHLLHLSLLREYLGWEFDSLKTELSFAYDIERIIDDWVLMGFLVGNDFIPHLPHVHIHDDALPMLYEIYRSVLPKLDGYINESGYLNLHRFGIFLQHLAENDRSSFLHTMEDAEWMRGRQLAGAEELVEYVDSDSQSEEEVEELSPYEAAFVSSDEEEESSTQNTRSDQKAANSCSSDDAVLPSASDILGNTMFSPIDDEFADAMALAEFRQMSDKEFENRVESCWSKAISNSFKRHKRDYYSEKMKFGNISKDELREQSEGYVRAIQWILHYYYHGCVSWSWYFKHHYAPYISDVVNFADMNLSYDLSEPFHPFEQLLAVLPAASSACLPPSLRFVKVLDGGPVLVYSPLISMMMGMWSDPVVVSVVQVIDNSRSGESTETSGDDIPPVPLMCDAESPIAEFYPQDFETDLNGKKNDWEAVVLIPFIDEKKLLDAIRSKSSQLSKEEAARNEFGPHILATTNPEAPPGNQAVVMHVDKDTYRIPREKVLWGLLPNVKLDVFFPGFPTMKHLPHDGMLQPVGVQVFQQASKRDSMVLKVRERQEMQRDLLEVSFDLIGKEVCIDWPVLKMAKVFSIWGLDKKFERLKYDEVTMIEMTELEKDETLKTIKKLEGRLMDRYAISCLKPEAVVYVQKFLGVSYEVVEGELRPIKQYSGPDDLVPILLPMLVTNILVDEGRKFNPIPINVAYPPKSKVFVMEPQWAGFGHPCLVEQIEKLNSPDCRVVVLAAVSAQPDLGQLMNQQEQFSMPWYNAMKAGRHASINHRLLSRLTGTMFLVNGEKTQEQRGMGFGDKLNIGLSLKLSKANKEVPDYTRKNEEGYWEYSMLTVRLLTEYRNKFRDLVTYLEKNDTVDDNYYSTDIWGNEEVRKIRVAELGEWLNSIPTAGIAKQNCGSEYLDSVLIGHLEQVLRNVPPKMQMVKSSVNPAKLYKAELHDTKARPDSEADFQLLDRVVHCRQGSTVPFGVQGTVIGIFEDRLEVLFDKPFAAGYKRCDMPHCARVPLASVINVTFGKERKGKPKTKSPRKGAGKNQQKYSSNTKNDNYASGPYEPWKPQSKKIISSSQASTSKEDSNSNPAFRQQKGKARQQSSGYDERSADTHEKREFYNERSTKSKNGSSYRAGDDSAYAAPATEDEKHKVEQQLASLIGLNIASNRDRSNDRDSSFNSKSTQKSTNSHNSQGRQMVFSAKDEETRKPITLLMKKAEKENVNVRPPPEMSQQMVSQQQQQQREQQRQLSGNPGRTNVSVPPAEYNRRNFFNAPPMNYRGRGGGGHAGGQGPHRPPMDFMRQMNNMPPPNVVPPRPQNMRPRGPPNMGPQGPPNLGPEVLSFGCPPTSLFMRPQLTFFNGPPAREVHSDYQPSQSNRNGGLHSAEYTQKREQAMANDPKLTDLKPTAVMHKNKPRGRGFAYKGGSSVVHQYSSETQSIPQETNNQEMAVEEDKKKTTTQRKQRKSRLAMKFEAEE